VALAWADDTPLDGVFGSKAFSGRTSSGCSAAQVKQAPRQPNFSSSKVDSGRPTVLAKPAISVMPVIALRDPCSYGRTSVAKADSYKPLQMATPINAQFGGHRRGQDGQQPVRRGPGQCLRSVKRSNGVSTLRRGGERWTDPADAKPARR